MPICQFIRTTETSVQILRSYKGNIATLLQRKKVAFRRSSLSVFDSQYFLAVPRFHETANERKAVPFMYSSQVL